jgi:two-component system chemotaxis response regulator CheY
LLSPRIAGLGHAYSRAFLEVSMKTCLIVDDSEVVRKVARSIFEGLQLEAHEAGSGQDALDMCAGAMPDLIFLDSHVPGMPTASFLSSLRNLPNGDKPIVIYCATDNDSKDIARALTAGADDYVLKPFDRETLRGKVAACGLA